MREKRQPGVRGKTRCQGFFRALFVGCLVAAVIGGTQCRRNRTAESSVKPEIYSLALKDMNGRSVTLEPFRGKVLVLNFWATWCGPCREEMPDLDRLNQAWNGKGFAVVGVSVDTALADAQSFAKEIQVGYPLYWDGMDGDLVKKLGGVVALPTTFIFNAEGEMVKRIIGPRTKKEFERIVKPLLPAGG